MYKGLALHYISFKNLCTSFKNCIGAIDVTLILIGVVPKFEQRVCWNRKSKQSINLLACVSPSLEFLSILSG